MIKMNICFDAQIWNRKLPNIQHKIRKILKKSINSEKKLINKNTEITILLTNSKKMSTLNYKFRGKRKDTDILSFPSEKSSFYNKSIKLKKIYLGDLVLSYNYIKKQKIQFEDYLKKILVHGYLHLIGYDHNNNKNFIKMEKAQNKILKLI